MTITAAYDEIVSRLETLLSSHARLPDPYDIPKNPASMLDLGWAITMTPDAQNTDRSVAKISSTAYNFEVTITRQFYSRSLNPDGKEDAEKLLLEDHETIVKDIHDNSLNITGNVLRYVGSGGIVPILSEKGEDRFLGIVLNITLEYFNK